MKVAVRAHMQYGEIYIRKSDLVYWLREEARLLREAGEDAKAEQTKSILAGIREVRA